MRCETIGRKKYNDENRYLIHFYLKDRVLSTIIVEKCKVMTSAAAPLWITFTSQEVSCQPVYSYLIITLNE
jgi:hypothetical protein